MIISKIEIVQGDESILLYGTYIDSSGLPARSSCVVSGEMSSSINSASVCLTLTLKTSRVNKLNTETMTVGDAAALQHIKLYMTDGTNEQLLYNLKVTGYDEGRSSSVLTATHDGINIAQTRREFIVTTNEDGTADIMQDILLPLIQSASGSGSKLTVENGSKYSGTVRETHFLKDAIVFQAHGQLVGELIQHILIATGGNNSRNPESEWVVMYADPSDSSRVVVADFGCGSGSDRTTAIEISVANGSILSTIDVTQSNKEYAINRAYFYRTIEAVYDDEGNLVTPGTTYKLYECIYDDTSAEYGERSTVVSYPEWIDTGDGGTEILSQAGLGICRANCRPQQTINLTCDAKVIFNSTLEPLNRVFHIIDNSRMKDYGEMVCIGYTWTYPSMQLQMTFAPNNPYIPQKMAETFSLIVQRVSALEAKTINLTCELVSQIGTASWSKVTIDCDKWLACRSLHGVKHIMFYGDLQAQNLMPKEGIISPDPSNPDDWVPYVSKVDGVDVSDHDHSGAEMGVAIPWNNLDKTKPLDCQYSSLTNLLDLSMTGELNNSSGNIKCPVGIVTSAGLMPSSNGAYNIGSSSYRWANAYIDSISAGDIIPKSNSYYDLGSSYYRWSNIYGASLNLSSTAIISGLITAGTGIRPQSNNSVYLGTSSYRFSDLYVVDVNCGGTAGYNSAKTWANTGNNEWPCKSAVQTALDTLGKISHSTGPQNTSWKTGGMGYMVFTSSGAIRFKIMWGRKDYASGIAQQIISFPISFNYPPVVVAWQVRDSSKEMGDARAPHNVSKEGFTMYSDSSAVNWVAMGV